jgi:hypothetical protein
MGKVSTAGRRNAAQLIIFGQISALAVIYYSIQSTSPVLGGGHGTLRQIDA